MSQALAVFRHVSVAIAAIGIGVVFLPSGDELGIREAEAGSCPEGMASIDGKYCIDKYEASTVEGTKGKRGRFKTAHKHSPYKAVTGLTVKAVSIKGRVPQGYISRDEAEEACENSGKRLCTDEEWLTACRGKDSSKYPYGDEHEDAYCNDSGLSGFNKLYGPGNGEPPEQSSYTRENMNDERLNELPGTIAPSGKFSHCKSSYKVYDMVGNLHEWTAAKAGTFRGGYYLDTHINGDGCEYRTTAHDALYHDYSTGFRCCYGGPEQKKIDAARHADASDESKKDADRKADKDESASKKSLTKKDDAKSAADDGDKKKKKRSKKKSKKSDG